MKNYSTLNEQIKAVIELELPGLIFYHHVEKMKGEINVFFIEFTNELSLRETWENVRNLIAVYLQNDLETDFERWNIYIIFVLPIAVPNELKYQIENDQLSSRKIVLDNFKQKLDDETRRELLSIYIYNDLSLPESGSDQQQRSTGYTSDSKVFSVINAPSKNKKGRDQLQFLYNNLLNKLKNEDSKG